MMRATILIPAHNEAGVIGRTLLHLSKGLSLQEFRIVVIANGCSDATAARARFVMPHATIIETDTAGKCAALNLGYKAADRHCPIICLDADLDVTAESLKALIAPLCGGEAAAACGQMDVCTAQASPLVRAYYTGWRMNPYFDRGKFGGVFALSPQAAARIFPLPEITADDEYIRRSLDPRDVAFVADCRFTVRAPLTLDSLARVRRRSLRGAREVTTLGLASPERRSALAMIPRVARSPRNLFDMTVYAALNAWVRLQLAFEAKTGANRWERDVTTRFVR